MFFRKIPIISFRNSFRHFLMSNTFWFFFDSFWIFFLATPSGYKNNALPNPAPQTSFIFYLP